MNTERMNLFLRKLRFNCAQGVHFLYKLFIEPKTSSEDSRRHELILNIILSCTIILLGCFDFSLGRASLRLGSNYHGIPFWLFTLLVGFFIFLLALSRKGYSSVASYLMIALYLVSTTLGIYQWGIELPLTSLAFVLIIIMSSILISTRFGLFMTLVISGIVLSVGYLEVHEIIMPHLYWKTTSIRMNDADELALMFMVMMTLSWLSNREIETSLRRARKSEHELALERDSLEIKVEERTRELKTLQAERVAELSRFAEFGKLSSGIFHDLMNPLHAVIANVSQMESGTLEVSEVKTYLEKAVYASRRMGDFLGSIRKQLQTNHEVTTFSINQEVVSAIDLLQFRAREAHVVCTFHASKEFFVRGNPIKFHQVALNLISNAIDASERTSPAETLPIMISITRRDHFVLFRVTDQGCGIPLELQNKIFDPFFTTKSSDRGIGIGLSSTKEIIEQELKGTICLQSTQGKGTSFSVFIPTVRNF